MADIKGSRLAVRVLRDDRPGGPGPLRLVVLHRDHHAPAARDGVAGDARLAPIPLRDLPHEKWTRS